MKTFQIFDCTKVMGCECHVRGVIAARLVAFWLTLVSGRLHDFADATPHSLHWDRYVTIRGAR